MYKDHKGVLSDLADYSSPKAKLSKMIRSGEVVHVKRGIFLEAQDTDYSLKSLASVIYGPSYISFESALAHHGLIPERVYAITSATYNKNKNKSFSTPIGDFHYFYLPKEIYPYGILREEEGGQGYLMATPEKAILDLLYKSKNINSPDDLESFLWEDKRMDEERLSRFDKNAISFLAPMYKKKQCFLFKDRMK
ncbi:type IV toxin-antitoxin system AbiEi family antitoxin domain-containing protein [Leptospira sp. 'Mane']|uniref:type IV toxin-antitoxin system AbiEi family antitoxin domain-containing protein n=1 Tax=Leptospira sp. 'Mane' TaxID=3387407 RepID=UPI00398B8B6F